MSLLFGSDAVFVNEQINNKIINNIPSMVGMGMTGTGMGMEANTKIGIHIRTHGTLTHIPARYTRTCAHH